MSYYESATRYFLIFEKVKRNVQKKIVRKRNVSDNELRESFKLADRVIN